MASLSSAASSRTPTSSAHNVGGGGNDSCYFPGCRKDANCHCEICVESFNATRDLHSALRFPAKKKTKDDKITPSYTPPSTPEPVSSVSIIPRSPPPAMKSTAKSRPKERLVRKEKKRGWGFGWFKVLLGLVGIWVLLEVDVGFLDVILKGFGPRLGTEMGRGFKEEAKGLKGRLRAVEREVKEVVGENGGVFSCSSLDSLWKLNQDGHHLFFQWRCVIYQSLAEELSVWGSPLPTSGILAAGLSPRSLALLSGQITEWSDGKLVATSRTSNASRSWTLEKWSSAAVQLETETWVLEYRRSALFQGTGLIQSAWDILGQSMQRIVRRFKWKLLMSRTTNVNYRISKLKQHFQAPT